MSEVRVDNLFNENLSGGPTISGIATLSSSNFLIPPSGNTMERPSGCPPGSIRFNTDSRHLEYYRGDTIGWADIDASYEDMSRLTNTPGTRAIYYRGKGAPSTNQIDYFGIANLANAADFGDAAVSATNRGGVASKTRGVVMGGQPGQSPYYINNCEFITISAKGNGTDFGDSTQTAGSEHDAASNNTRGIRGCGGGQSGGFINVIEYITIAETGNALDFGDLSSARGNSCQALSGKIRGIFAGGYTPTVVNVIEYVNFSTTGDAVDFGDLTQTTRRAGAGGNSVRGVHYGGATPTVVNTISLINIASTGNAVDFGDSRMTAQKMGAVSSATRAVFCGGYSPAVSSPGAFNSMDYLELASLGNSKVFGDLNGADGAGAPMSNGHGGLQ